MMHTHGKRLILLFVCLGCLFLCSCGLDEYFVINPPSASEVSVDQDDTSLMKYSFQSADQLSSLIIKGIKVYYKIYSDKDTLSTERDKIKSTNTEYSENGYFWITDGISPEREERYKLLNENWNIPQSTGITWEIGFKEEADTENEKAMYLRASDDSVDRTYYVTSPKQAETEYYINAYAVTEGQENLTSHYSALTPLGVLKFTIQ